MSHISGRLQSNGASPVFGVAQVRSPVSENAGEQGSGPRRRPHSLPLCLIADEAAGTRGKATVHGRPTWFSPIDWGRWVWDDRRGKKQQLTGLGSSVFLWHLTILNRIMNISPWNPQSRIKTSCLSFSSLFPFPARPLPLGTPRHLCLSIAELSSFSFLSKYTSSCAP